MNVSDTSGMNVAAELASLRGEMTTGFAQLDGKLSLIVQAQDTVSADVSELDRRVSALEARRWPLGTVAALSGAVSALVALAAFLVAK